MPKPLVFFLLIVLPLLLLWLFFAYNKKTNRKTQRFLSDRDLLRMLRDEPDQLLSPHQLSNKTELTLRESRKIA